MMTFAVIAALATVITIGGKAIRSKLLIMFAMVFWVVAGIWSYTMSTTPTTTIWDMHYALFFVCLLGGPLMCLGMALTMRDPKEDQIGDIYVDDLDRQEKENEDLWRGTRAPAIGRRAAIRRSRKKED